MEGGQFEIGFGEHTKITRATNIKNTDEARSAFGFSQKELDQIYKNEKGRSDNADQYHLNKIA
ncbi:MAG: hypothetical protein ACJAV6_000668 [Candidatus Paceibacteria bacterium]|jgi:hypothetical protein